MRQEGVAALAALHDETGGSTILEALDDKSDDCWVYGASRLLARLRALTRVVELFPEDIATSDVVDRVKASLIEQRPPADLAFEDTEGRSSLSGSDFGRPKNDQAFAEAFLALRAALKVVTAQARPLQDKECGREKAARQDAFDLCFRVIDSDGEPPRAPVHVGEGRLRLTSNALALCANKEANRELSASRPPLVSVLVDRDDVVRNSSPASRRPYLVDRLVSRNGPAR